MLKNNQIWENKSKIAKLQRNDGKMEAIIFNIKSNGLQFHDVVSSENKDLEKYMKKSRMRPTDKVLTLEES